MKIREEYQKEKHSTISVKAAEYLGNFIIKVRFNSGEERKVDFKPFLQKSHHPQIRKYLNETLFKKFDIIDGNLNWNDYDLIFPIWNLYQGKIE